MNVVAFTVKLLFPSNLYVIAGSVSGSQWLLEPGWSPLREVLGNTGFCNVMFLVVPELHPEQSSFHYIVVGIIKSRQDSK